MGVEEEEEGLQAMAHPMTEERESVRIAVEANPGILKTRDSHCSFYFLIKSCLIYY